MPRALVVEIDGSYHYYNDIDRVPVQKTNLKYRLLDLYNIPYVRIECWDHIVPSEDED